MPITETDVYTQDCENMRYHDTVKWSRFRVAALIEGAITYFIWGLSPGPVSSRLVSCAALALIGFLAVLSYIDEADYKAHLKRIQLQEKAHPDLRFQRQPLGWPLSMFKRRVTGGEIIRLAWIVLISFNILVIRRAFGVLGF